MEIAAGSAHAVARRSDGSVVAWGSNSLGQWSPPVLPAGQSWVEIAANGNFTMGRRSGGAVVSWPNGNWVFAPQPAGLEIVEIAAGAAHALARRADGSVIAYGTNTYGECSVPALPPGLSYVEIAAGSYHSVARRSDGSIVAWGANFDGQCDVPALPPGITYSEICCGARTHRRTALRRVGDRMGSRPPSQCNMPALGQVAMPSTSRSAIGTLRCSNPTARSSPGVATTRTSVPSRCSHPGSTSSMSMPRRMARSRVAPTARWSRGGRYSRSSPSSPLPAGLTCVEVATGAGHTLARRSDGRVVGWGFNGSGECALPPLSPRLAYVEIAASGDVNSGGSSVARRSDGLVFTSGVVGYMSSAPALPPGLTYVAVAAGIGHALALRSDGQVICWGSYYNPAHDNVPALPAGMEYVAVATCWTHSAALRSDGALIAWGDNTCGQCNTPPAPPGFAYVDVDVAAYRTVARLGPIGIGNPLDLSITQDFTAGCGPVVFSVVGAAPMSELYNLVSLSYSGGGGPLFGVGFDAWSQLLLPLGTHPFHVRADVVGSYGFSLPVGGTMNVFVEAVTVELIAGTSVLANISPTTGWISLSL